MKEELNLRYCPTQLVQCRNKHLLDEKKSYVALMFIDMFLQKEDFYIVCLDESSIRYDLHPSKTWAHRDISSRQVKKKHHEGLTTRDLYLAADMNEIKDCVDYGAFVKPLINKKDIDSLSTKKTSTLER